MQKVLHINADKCTGCLQCEMACSFENYGTFATAKSRIKVFDFHHTGKKVPYTCTQCDEAWCLHACPVEAITVDKLTKVRSVRWRAGLCRRLPHRRHHFHRRQLDRPGQDGAVGRQTWQSAFGCVIPNTLGDHHVMGWKNSSR